MNLKFLASIPQTECLSLELTTVGAGDTKIDIYLTLRFKQASQNLLGGQLQYALTGGQLSLKLENAKLLISPLPLSVPIFAESNSHTGDCNITAAFETEPMWTFTFNRPALNGIVQDFKLGSLEILDFPAVVTARFDVSPKFVSITGTEKLWHPDISPNKHAILQTKLVGWLQKNHLLSPCSWVVVLKYDSPEVCEISRYENYDATRTDATELQEPIQEVLAAKTDNFIELLGLAGLNPLVDLAGANLLGVSLEGVDLSNANLQKINLRGALLNDVDLSGANLSGANLAGADLSGALLSDANLENADLHKSSLALASLAGANLSGANLREANLSNANLSDADLSNANLSDADLKGAGLVLTKLAGVELAGANVEGARFRHDLGIAEELQKNLIERGAIFEP